MSIRERKAGTDISGLMHSSVFLKKSQNLGGINFLNNLTLNQDLIIF